MSKSDIVVNKLATEARSFINFSNVNIPKHYTKHFRCGIKAIANTKYQSSITSILYSPENKKVYMVKQVRAGKALHQYDTLANNTQDIKDAFNHEAVAGFIETNKETPLNALIRELNEEIGMDNFRPITAAFLSDKTFYSSPETTGDNLYHTVATISPEQAKFVEENVVVGNEEEQEAVVVNSFHIDEIMPMIEKGEITNAISITNFLLFLANREEIEKGYSDVMSGKVKNADILPKEVNKEDIPLYRQVDTTPLVDEENRAKITNVKVPIIESGEKDFTFQIARTQPLSSTIIYLPETDEFVFGSSVSQGILSKTGDLKEASNYEAFTGFINQNETSKDASYRILNETLSKGESKITPMTSHILLDNIYPCPGTFSTTSEYRAATLTAKQAKILENNHEIIKIPRKEIKQAIKDGAFRDGATINTLLLTMRKLDFITMKHIEKQTMISRHEQREI